MLIKRLSCNPLDAWRSGFFFDTWRPLNFSILSDWWHFKVSLFRNWNTEKQLNWHSWILKILSLYFSVEFTHLFLHKQSDATGNHLLHLALHLKSCEKKLTWLRSTATVAGVSRAGFSRLQSCCGCFLNASVSKVYTEQTRRQDNSSEHLLCGWKLLVDECEGCINVGDAG